MRSDFDWRIVYFGDANESSNSFYRAQALKRLGNHVVVYDPSAALGQNRFIRKFHYETGYRFAQPALFKWIGKSVSKLDEADLIWVNSGEYFGPRVMNLLRSTKAKLVLYNNDDPTGDRDGRRFDSLLKSIPFYDLCAVTRDVNIDEYKRIGAGNVINAGFGYDEKAHSFSRKDLNGTQMGYLSEVSFIGTNIKGENRDEFLMELIRSGLKVSIWGSRWEKSKHWNQLRDHFRGQHLGGQDYISVIRGSKICLGLLSKGNRDQVTARSYEIPYAKGVLCAERTAFHEKLYEEDNEAVFFNDVEDCVIKCSQLLADDSRREKIREQGHKKALELDAGNESRCARILERIETLND